MAPLTIREYSADWASLPRSSRFAERYMRHSMLNMQVTKHRGTFSRSPSVQRSPTFSAVNPLIHCKSGIYPSSSRHSLRQLAGSDVRAHEIEVQLLNRSTDTKSKLSISPLKA